MPKTQPGEPPAPDELVERVLYWARRYRNEGRLLNPRLYAARDELFKAVDALESAQ